MTAFFVTGTDTAAGKTLVTSALLLAAREQGWRTIGLKPVAAGCRLHDGQWVNDDALLLQRCATEALDYAVVNPVALRCAMAPHIAAADEGVRLDVGQLLGHCRRARALPHDLLLAEGAGGWLVPLNERESMADLVAALGWPVILVVALRLGCLNHALLTAAAIRGAGLDLGGWVANSAGPPMERLDDNVAALRERLDAPCLGVVPWLGAAVTPQAAACFLRVDVLRGDADDRV